MRIIRYMLIFMLSCYHLSLQAQNAEDKGAAATPPAITAEAKQALLDAETTVAQARKQHALWTSSEDALRRAQEAVKKGDSKAVIENSALASDLAKLGIAQTAYPLFQ